MVFLGLAILVGFTGMCYFYIMCRYYQMLYYKALRERDVWRQVAWDTADTISGRIHESGF